MQQAFCEDHWKELIPRIKDGEVNGIALQPLALEALWSHEAVLDEFEPKEGDKLDAKRVVTEASPICCFLEGRTRYSEGTEFEDDYQILLAMGEYPLDERTGAVWFEQSENEEEST